MFKMKLTVALLLLAAVSDAAKSDSKSQRKPEEKPDKRGLVEGNAGIDKRTPLLPTVPPTAGGVEYADTEQTLQDKSPAQQIYTTPEPQKISDFLTGQGPPFQSAIASHLYSPISVYNPRFGAPTTYEVSAPVPSQLAYTEHRLSVPQQNSLQYSPKPQKLAKPFNNVQPRVISQQSYEQQNLGYEPLVHQVPNNAINNFQPVQYKQAPQGQIEQQQLHYVQGQPIQIIPRNIQQHPIQYKKQHLEQRDIKNQPAPAQVLDKQSIQQVYNDKQQKALSFATFTYNPSSEAPAPSYDQNQNQQLYTQPQPSQFQPQPQLQQQHQLQLQPQPQQQYHQSQQIIASQPQQYKTQPYEQYQLQQPTQLPQTPYQIPQELQYQAPQQLQYQPQAQLQYHDDQQQFYQQIQPQLLQAQVLPQPQAQAPQYIQHPNYQLQQAQPQYFDQPEPIAKQTIAEKQYYKQAPIQPRYSQQLFPQQQLQSQAYKQPVTGIASLPTFPPVQYFGKFAHSIFGNSQH